MKFFYNGVKVDKKLYRGFFSYSPADERRNVGEEVHFLGRDYERLPKEVHEHVMVVNNTDSREDYFDQDHFSVFPGGPYWLPALECAMQYEERGLKHYLERLTQRGMLDDDYAKGEVKGLREKIARIKHSIESAQTELAIKAVAK